MKKASVTRLIWLDKVKWYMMMCVMIKVGNVIRKILQIIEIVCSMCLIN